MTLVEERVQVRKRRRLWRLRLAWLSREEKVAGRSQAGQIVFLHVVFHSFRFIKYLQSVTGASALPANEVIKNYDLKRNRYQKKYQQNITFKKNICNKKKSFEFLGITKYYIILHSSLLCSMTSSSITASGRRVLGQWVQRLKLV